MGQIPILSYIHIYMINWSILLFLLTNQGLWRSNSPFQSGPNTGCPIYLYPILNYSLGTKKDIDDTEGEVHVEKRRVRDGFCTFRWLHVEHSVSHYDFFIKRYESEMKAKIIPKTRSFPNQTWELERPDDICYLLTKKKQNPIRSLTLTWYGKPVENFILVK